MGASGSGSCDLNLSELRSFCWNQHKNWTVEKMFCYIQNQNQNLEKISLKTGSGYIYKLISKLNFINFIIKY